MSQPREIIQDELNIKEMIEILWKGKVIIAIITIIAIIASTIAYIFIIPERYEATASVNVAPIAMKVSALNDTVSIGEIISYKASLQDIKIQIESDTSALQVLESASQSNSIIPSQDYNLSIDLNNDPETVGSNQVNITPDNLSGSLLTINIIAIQTRLVSNQAKAAAYEKIIPELESALTVTQTTLTDEEYK